MTGLGGSSGSAPGGLQQSGTPGAGQCTPLPASNAKNTIFLKFQLFGHAFISGTSSFGRALNCVMLNSEDEVGSFIGKEGGTRRTLPWLIAEISTTCRWAH